MPINSEVPVVTSLISRICQLSLSEVHIRVELHACIHRVTQCACECVCTVFRKKKRVSESFLFAGKGPELVIMTQNVINVYF